jgi:hypothetical protein
MRALKKMCLLFLIISLAIGSFYSLGWGQSDPAKAEWSILDLVFARPLGILAGIAGTGIFIASLPFTIPSHSVNKASKMFIVEPFKFSFVRDLSDNGQKENPRETM